MLHCCIRYTYAIDLSTPSLKKDPGHSSFSFKIVLFIHSSLTGEAVKCPFSSDIESWSQPERAVKSWIEADFQQSAFSDSKPMRAWIRCSLESYTGVSFRRASKNSRWDHRFFRFASRKNTEPKNTGCTPLESFGRGVFPFEQIKNRNKTRMTLRPTAVKDDSATSG